jgi:hypothetical protein
MRGAVRGSGLDLRLVARGRIDQARLRDNWPCDPDRQPRHRVVPGMREFLGRHRAGRSDPLRRATSARACATAIWRGMSACALSTLP